MGKNAPAVSDSEKNDSRVKPLGCTVARMRVVRSVGIAVRISRKMPTAGRRAENSGSGGC